MKRKKSKRKKNQLNGTSSQEIIIDLPAEKVRLNEITLQSKEKKKYTITKVEFWDLVKIRYGWLLSLLLSIFSCGRRYNLQHSLTCKEGGIVITCPHQTSQYNRSVANPSM